MPVQQHSPERPQIPQHTPGAAQVFAQKPQCHAVHELVVKQGPNSELFLTCVPPALPPLAPAPACRDAAGSAGGGGARMAGAPGCAAVPVAVHTLATSFSSPAPAVMPPGAAGTAEAGAPDAIRVLVSNPKHERKKERSYAH